MPGSRRRPGRLAATLAVLAGVSQEALATRDAEPVAIEIERVRALACPDRGDEAAAAVRRAMDALHAVAPPGVPTTPDDL